MIFSKLFLPNIFFTIFDFFKIFCIFSIAHNREKCKKIPTAFVYDGEE
jgi:hypothetical protein